MRQREKEKESEQERERNGEKQGVNYTVASLCRQGTLARSTGQTLISLVSTAWNKTAVIKIAEICSFALEKREGNGVGDDKKKKGLPSLSPSLTLSLQS